MYKRFKWNPDIRFEPEVFDEFRHIYRFKQGTRIFVGSTMELFGDWVKDEWMQSIMTWVKTFHEYTFIFLTKQPQNLIKYSPFPENCWVGVTATDGHQFVDALNNLVHIKASVQFISFEPLLDWHIESWLVETDLKSQSEINWLIIGQQTPISVKTQPKLEWIREIVEAVDRAGIPIFLKDNLRPMLCDALATHKIERGKFFKGRELRQELPVAKTKNKT
jgi:protein gp37